MDRAARLDVDRIAERQLHHATVVLRKNLTGVEVIRPPVRRGEGDWALVIEDMNGYELEELHYATQMGALMGMIYRMRGREAWVWTRPELRKKGEETC